MDVNQTKRASLVMIPSSILIDDNKLASYFACPALEENKNLIEDVRSVVDVCMGRKDITEINKHNSRTSKLTQQQRIQFL